MNRRRVNKIIDNVVLSIRYARLKEEVKETKEKQLVVVEKKKSSASNEKKREKDIALINRANQSLRTIERANEADAYLLVENNTVNEQLDKLSKHWDYGFLKYTIALKMVMDDSFEYTESTTVDFYESISQMLFGDKNVISDINNDFQAVATAICGTDKKSWGEVAATLIEKIPVHIIADSAKDSKKMMDKITAGIANKAVGFGLKTVKSMLKKHAKQASLPPLGDFANELIVSAMNLLYRNDSCETEVLYQKYFISILKDINIQRQIITKQLFEMLFDVEENRHKLKLLQNYDNYIIGQMDSKLKKKEGT